MQDSAGIKAYHRGSKILNVAVIGNIFGIVAVKRFDVVTGPNPFAGHAVYRDRFWFSKQIAGKVNHMHPKVNQRAAAGTLFIRKPAAGIAGAADAFGFYKINLAQVAVVNKGFGNFSALHKTADKANHQQLAVFLCGSFHIQAKLRVKRQRFFT